MLYNRILIWYVTIHSLLLLWLYKLLNCYNCCYYYWWDNYWCDSYCWDVVIIVIIIVDIFVAVIIIVTIIKKNKWINGNMYTDMIVIFNLFILVVFIKNCKVWWEEIVDGQQVNGLIIRKWKSKNEMIRS